MKKMNSKVYIIELLLAVILSICTLFHLTANRYFTAGLLAITAVILYFTIKRKRMLLSNRKKVTIIVTIFAILYIALFYTMGLYTSFYNNTASLSLKVLVKYIFPITIIILAMEYIRDRLLVNDSKKSQIMIFIIGTLVDISIYLSIYNLEYLDGFLSFIGLISFAAIANNLLYNYICKNYGPKPVIIYKLITILYIYLLPIIPNVYKYLRTFLRMLYPMIVYMYIEKYYYQDKFKERPQEESNRILSILSTSAVILVIIALISCKFLYGILVIGSGSMSHAIDKGDLVFYKQTNKIKKDDVIVFESNDIKIVHRVVAVKNVNNEERYYTKGDANKEQDNGYVTKDNLMGKVLFKIKYIGKPTLWLNEAFR